ncbi:MAG TPA: rhodanese-like domain-containing protein [Kofleriaceae bacterium]|jgi:rhodanese-related sulfurtransferase|nr:rhodanese-like domain-containing protein [Kofleriaceae bacterium]
MRALARSLLGLGLAVFALGPAGCSRRADAPDQRPAAIGAVTAVSAVSVDELDRLLASHQCIAVDANGDSTRRQMGVIPGAVLLRDLDATDQLPPDKATGLVFYCANPACGASHEAAEKAIAAGYTHVRVLPDGIAGWVKAGKRTTATSI